MKVIRLQVKNFASYHNFEMDFDSQGLCLISGATGSGKSTLCDMVPWILFGKTSKGGSVDDIINWGSNSDAEGTIELILSKTNQSVIIYRQRGRHNDLLFKIDDNEPTRGRDITDTQKLINQLLNLDLDIYLTGAYFNEFSQTASFFTASAKTRRNLTESIVDLSLCTNLTQKSSVLKKQLNSNLELKEKVVASKTQILEITTNKLIKLREKSETWEADKLNSLRELRQRSEQFEMNKEHYVEELYQSYYNTELDLKNQIETIRSSAKSKEYYHDKKAHIEADLGAITQGTCPTCGSRLNDNRLVLMKDLHKLQTEETHNNQLLIEINRAEQILKRHTSPNNQLLKTIQNELSKENTYLEQIKDLESKVDPYSELISAELASKSELKVEIKSLNSEVQSIKTNLLDIEVLSLVINDLRLALVKQTIIDIQNNTNKYLNEYFDAEIQVQFEMEDSDKLNVDITKDGNKCSYSQLSKGQRQLLKLCFSISVMKVIHTKFANFDTIFLDEALDGLDEELKLKSYRLLEELALTYKSVFVVEHNTAFKSLFSNVYEVRLINGESKIQAA